MGLLARFWESRAHPGSSSGWSWLLGGADTYTGRRVDERSALSMSTVYACIRAISEPSSMLPMLMYERSGDSGSGKERADAHPVYKLLKTQPNPEQTPFEWKELMLSHTAAWGNGYSEIEWSRSGYPMALWPLNPSQMNVKRQRGRLWYHYTTPDGKQHRLAHHQVLHLRGRGGNSVVGYNMLQEFAKESVGLALAQEEHGARFYGNSARPGVVLRHPGKLSDQAASRLEKSWADRHQGLENSHRVGILEEGMDISTIGIPPVDAQFLESRKFQVEEICRWFNVPPHMVQHLENATFSNIEHQSLDFVTHTLGPWLVRFEQVVKRDLLLEDEQERYLVEFLTDALVRGDIATRYQAYSTGRQWGWFSVNEIRAKENMNPIEGGDEYMVPLNMVPAGETSADEEENDGDTLRNLDPPELDAGQRCDCESCTEQRGAEFRADDDEEPEDVRRIRQARQRLARSYVGLFKEVAARVVSRETNDVRGAVNKHLRKRSMSDFLEWLGAFYRDFDEVLMDAFRALMLTYGDQVLASVAGELDEDEDGLTDELREFIEAYLAAFGAAWAASSRRQIEALAAGDDEDAAAAIEERLDGWRETRASKAGLQQAFEGLNALTYAAYGAYGVIRYRWAASPDSCPFCLSINGKVIERGEFFVDGGTSIDAGDGSTPMLVRRSKRYGPLHGGCDCVMVAA